MRTYLDVIADVVVAVVPVQRHAADAVRLALAPAPLALVVRGEVVHVHGLVVVGSGIGGGVDFG